MPITCTMRRMPNDSSPSFTRLAIVHVHPIDASNTCTHGMLHQSLIHVQCVIGSNRIRYKIVRIVWAGCSIGWLSITTACSTSEKMVKYVLQRTLFKHSDSINTRAFTHDGSLFASGADDGLIVVFKGNGRGNEVHRFQMKAPITTLLWHSRFGYTVIAGDACGDVHTISLNNSTNVSASRFCTYMDINDIPFTEKRVLPYF